MSKSYPRSSQSVLSRVFVIIAMCFGCMLCDSEESLAQEKGYSIFEPAKEVDADPPVSAKEAFTNPLAKLPSSQFGTFNDKKSGTAEPKLKGSQAIGTYAHDGRTMFKQSPGQTSTEEGKLKPFAANTLRASPGPETDSGIENGAAPIVIGDFSNARRLSGNEAKEAADESPKVAQVAFQEDAGSRFGQSAANRFGQPSSSAASRFGQSSAGQPASENRFGGSASSSQSQGLVPRSTPKTMQQPFRPSQPKSTFQQPATASQPPKISSTGFSNSRTNPQSSTAPPVRTAALPKTMMQPTTGQQPMSTRQPTSRKSGSKAAKELLANWVEEAGNAKLPGKRLKLHEFLAMPIRGSKRDAINQYWVTFSDLANHKLALDQSKWLTAVTPTQQPADQAMLKAAQQAAQNRVLHTEIQLAKSQSILADYLPNLRGKNGNNIPVIPADVPWVGKLNTKFSVYKKRGIVPARFNAIDQILPKARQLIANRADAVIASSQATEQARTAMVSGRAPVANLLEAIRLKEKNEQDFLATDTGYNRAITDYVLAVRQDIYQPKKLASVLIGKKSVQPTLAKKDTPEPDDDPLSVLSRQTSDIDSSLQSSSKKDQLPGVSAYQNSAQQEKPSSPFSTVSSNLAKKKAAQTFEYGPTKESAAAAKFDPTKVRSELPIQQAKAKTGAGNSRGYNANSRPAGTGNVRSASSLNQPSQPIGGPSGGFGSANRTTRSNQSGAQLPAVTQSPRRFNDGATNSGVKPAGSGSTFPPIRKSNPAATPPPSMPAGGSPFSAMGSGSETTSSTRFGGSSNSTFGGGGAFGESAPKTPSSTASRFGEGSTRR